MTPILEVQDLHVSFQRGHDSHVAVHNVSFTIAAGETVALVGASGSGKSALTLAIMGLLPQHAHVAPQSRVRFEGADWLAASPRERAASLGRRLSMVFQEPSSALNPRMRVVDQIAEVAVTHTDASHASARTRAREMLARVGLTDLERTAAAFPHELSGGQQQRVLIAMALLLQPALLIADEPTSALDVTTQAAILALLAERQRQTAMAMLFVTHDFGVAAAQCQRALVLHEGRIVEDAPMAQLLHAPSHPHTVALLHAARQLAFTP